jgi:hypothetical protein
LSLHFTETINKIIIEVKDSKDPMTNNIFGIFANQANIKTNKLIIEITKEMFIQN